MIGEPATFVKNSNFFQNLSQVLIRLLQSLSESLNRPILELAETFENSVQKLVLWNTGSLEMFALLGLVDWSSAFL